MEIVIMSLDYMQRQQQEALDEEQAILASHDDDQLLLVKEYWMWVDGNVFYKLLQPVPDQLQAYIAAHQRFSPNSIVPVKASTRFGLPVTLLQFYPQIICLIITTGALRTLLDARQKQNDQRVKDQMDRFR
jgi:hypothetical protein